MIDLVVPHVTLVIKINLRVDSLPTHARESSNKTVVNAHRTKQLRSEVGSWCDVCPQILHKNLIIRQKDDPIRGMKKQKQNFVVVYWLQTNLRSGMNLVTYSYEIQFPRPCDHYTPHLTSPSVLCGYRQHIATEKILNSMNEHSQTANTNIIASSTLAFILTRTRVFDNTCDCD